MSKQACRSHTRNAVMVGAGAGSRSVRSLAEAEVDQDDFVEEDLPR